MKPSLGRIVHYVAAAGEIRSAIITRVWNDTCVNLHVFLDGDMDLHSRQTSVVQTSETEQAPGRWFWPPRV